MWFQNQISLKSVERFAEWNVRTDKRKHLHYVFTLYKDRIRTQNNAHALNGIRPSTEQVETANEPTLISADCKLCTAHLESAYVTACVNMC